MVIDGKELRVLQLLCKKELGHLGELASYYDGIGRTDMRNKALAGVSRLEFLARCFEGASPRVVLAVKGRVGRPSGGSKIHEMMLVSD